MLRLGIGALSVPFWCLCQKSLSHFNKTLLHKSSWVIKPGPSSRSEIFFFGDHKSDTIHCKSSSWVLIRDLQNKVRTLRALDSLLSQYTHFLLYFSNSTVCLREWMTRLARSKWWTLLSGFVVPRNVWREPPKGEPCQAFSPTCQCQDPNIPVRGAARNGQSMWTEVSFLGHFFLVSLSIA